MPLGCKKGFCSPGLGIWQLCLDPQGAILQEEIEKSSEWDC